MVILSDSEQPITLARLLIENAIPSYAGENSVSRSDKASNKKPPMLQ